MADHLNYETFQQLAGEAVELSLGELSLQGTIAEVTRLNRHDETAREPFSVLFITEQAQAVEQQIFTMKHSAVGELELFLVPLGPRSGKMCYEAVFT